jgi:hypothetical protein
MLQNIGERTKRAARIGPIVRWFGALSLLTSVRFMFLLKSFHHLTSVTFRFAFHYNKPLLNDNERDCVSAVNNTDSFIIKAICLVDKVMTIAVHYYSSKQLINKKN